eukprot:6160689-Pleurochrysis_carterae.AAC.1
MRSVHDCGQCFSSDAAQVQRHAVVVVVVVVVVVLMIAMVMKGDCDDRNGGDEVRDDADGADGDVGGPDGDGDEDHARVRTRQLDSWSRTVTHKSLVERGRRVEIRQD